MKKQIIVSFVLHGLLLAAAFDTANGQGAMLALHSGNNNPTTEGFLLSTTGTPFLGPVTGDLGNNAWAIGASAASVSYRHPLANFSSLDWILSVNIRIVSNSLATSAFSTGLNTGNALFRLYFGSNADGDPTVVASGSRLSPLFVLPGAGSTYHNFQLAFNAASGTAALWADGVNLYGGLTGNGVPTGNSGISFGGGLEGSASLLAHWNRVSLQVVPEPSSLALLCCGGFLLAARRCRVRPR